MTTSRKTWILIGAVSCCVAVMAWTAPIPLWRPYFVAASLCAAGLVVLVWRRGDVSLTTVLTLALIFRLALVWMPPTLSDDAYRYVWDGFLQTQGINPYQYVPEAEALAAYQDEPIFEALNSKSYYSVYPPLSQLIFRIGAAFYDQGWPFSYYVIKGILAGLEFGAVLVLSRLVGPAALLLYAWNPLALIAGAGQAHGESALVFFLTLTLWTARRGRGGAASVWLACAAWVKLYPLVLFPFLWRRFGWRSMAVGLATLAALAAPYAHPAAPLNVGHSLELYVRLFEFNAGFYYLVKEIFEVVTGADWSKQIGPAFRVFFALALPFIYALDWRRKWSLRRSFAVTVGAFFLLSTTVHPWYLLGILVLVVPARPVAWHWHWLSVVSIGTYLLYTGGPYWLWVILGWAGWMSLVAFRYGRTTLDQLMRTRARSKADLLAPLLRRGESILDLGAAEGFVSERLVRKRDVRASLVDVVDMNRTSLPHLVYDGMRLPYSDNAYDAVIIVYVLHHVDNPRTVVQEALRVARRRVFILESTYSTSWGRWALQKIDRLANFVRSGGSMDTESLHFRTLEGWTNLFERARITVLARRDLGGIIHHRALFILDAEPSP